MIIMVMGHKYRDRFKGIFGKEAGDRLAISRVDDQDLPGSGCGGPVRDSRAAGDQPDIVVAEGGNSDREIHVSQIPDVTVSY
jgi:hypothetical protein